MSNIQLQPAVQQPASLPAQTKAAIGLLITFMVLGVLGLAAAGMGSAALAHTPKFSFMDVVGRSGQIALVAGGIALGIFGVSALYALAKFKKEMKEARMINSSASYNSASDEVDSKRASSVISDPGSIRLEGNQLLRAYLGTAKFVMDDKRVADEQHVEAAVTRSFSKEASYLSNDEYGYTLTLRTDRNLANKFLMIVKIGSQEVWVKENITLKEVKEHERFFVGQGGLKRSTNLPVDSTPPVKVDS